MASNPFEGGWGFTSRPTNEPDDRFDVKSTLDPNKVIVVFKSPQKECDGVTNGNVLRFDRHVDSKNLTIHYDNGRIEVIGPPDRMRGDSSETADPPPPPSAQSQYSATKGVDDDWVATRPA